MNAASPMTLKFRPGLRLSDEAFWKLCRANPDMRLERTSDGELEIMAPAGSDSGRRNVSLTSQLWIWNQAAGLGEAFDSSSGFTLPNHAVRAPDASWIARDRWDALTRNEQERFAPICPDFVIELSSPTDEAAHLRAKMREYIEQGARLGWLIDPKADTVEIHRPGRQVETLTRPATLSGEDVLPGFVLDLKGILFD